MPPQKKARKVFSAGKLERFAAEKIRRQEYEFVNFSELKLQAADWSLLQSSRQNSGFFPAVAELPITTFLSCVIIACVLELNIIWAEENVLVDKLIAEQDL